MSKAFKKKFKSTHEGNVRPDEKNLHEEGRLKIVKGVSTPEVLDATDLNAKDETFKGFELKSEYREKDVKLKEPTKKELEEPEKTNVIVYRENSVESINPKDLKEIIKTTKDIKQVVVEKISVQDASRVSLLYTPVKEDKKIKLERKSAQIEKLDKVTLLETNVMPGEKAYQESSARELPNFKKLEMRVNKKFFRTGFDPAEADPIKLQIKKKNQIGSFEEDNFQLENQDDKVLKKLSYEKHTLTRKKGKIHNGFYYRVKDHMELFKVGSSFLNDFKDGIKNFSFTSYKLKRDQEKSVFGISSFFNYHTDVKQLIVSTDFDKTFYKEFVNKFDKRSVQVFDEEIDFNVWSTRGFDIVDFNELGKVERKIREYDFEDFLDEFIDQYDMILWDLPEIPSLDSRKELFFPVIRLLDNVSFIVKGNSTKMADIEKMMAYFQKYQIKIKGLLYSSPEKGGAA